MVTDGPDPSREMKISKKGKDARGKDEQPERSINYLTISFTEMLTLTVHGKISAVSKYQCDAGYYGQLQKMSRFSLKLSGRTIRPHP